MREYGNQWTRGGKFRRKRMLSIDGAIFADYAEKLDKLGADLKEVFTEALLEGAEVVQRDTIKACDKANMPKRGKFSRGETLDSVIKNPTVKWNGYRGEVALGFDKTLDGHGGFLITGTPKMSPNYALETIYGRKSYESKIKDIIEDELKEKLKELGGK